ncbi:MAG: hypothetical protein ACT4PU_07145 [Planctomycetota bacterium]
MNKESKEVRELTAAYLDWLHGRSQVCPEDLLELATSAETLARLLDIMDSLSLAWLAVADCKRGTSPESKSARPAIQSIIAPEVN